MSWELRNVGWPIPLERNWPVRNQAENQSDNYIMQHRDQAFILPWGYTWFLDEHYKGRQIDLWI